MHQLLSSLLALLFFLSGPAMGRNADFWRSTLAAEETAVGSKTLVPYYPPNQGFAGASGEASLVPGTIVDRYGGTGGSFLSPQGTPPWARSLPFGAETRPLNSYQVMQPINVNADTAAPWFNQPGGGLQFDLGTRTVQDLINSGHLKPLP